MCYQPIQIYNNSKQIGNYSPIIYTVPCGECGECRQQKGVDICLRCMAEYQTCKQLGGYAFFDTLTYNNQNLPKFHGVSCFDKTHIGSFMKRLRSKIDRKFGSSGISKLMLSYCVVSEFGDNFGRVHYHVIFFVKYPSLNVYTLKAFIRSAWYYGFVDPNTLIQKHLVNSNAVLHYMTKYINKYPEWLDVYKTVLSHRCNNKAMLEQGLKRVRPFYRCSNNLGFQFIKDNVDIDRGIVHIQDNECSRDFTLSRYYVYKLYYDIVKTDDGKYRYQINDLGISKKIQQLNSIIDATTLRYRNIFLNLEPYEKERVLDCLAGRSLNEVATYSVVFKNCACGERAKFDPIEFYIHSRYPFDKFQNPLLPENHESFNECQITRLDFVSKYLIKDDIPQFLDFDRILQILNTHANKLKHDVSAARTHSEKLYKSLKNVL